MSKRSWLVLVVLAVGLVFTSSALAQDSAPGGAGLPDPPSTGDPGEAEAPDDRVDARASGDLMPFGHECERQEGVRFCPTKDDEDRIPSFDDVPLDVDVTLPKKGRGPFPTIVMMHGYGGDKTDFETQGGEGAEGDGNITHHYNNVYYAKKGYAVVNYSVRGFGRSCGAKDSREDPNCDDGYIHLADQRFEVRDTQYLLGLLEAGDPDEKGDNQEITKAKRIGVTGISYGGGQSIMLALLRNRIADCDRSEAKQGRSNCDPRPDGGLNRDLKKWKSPDGDRMAIAAAFPRWPWSDLDASLLPNGRFRDFERSDDDESRNPIGIPIESFLAGLNALGKASGYYCGDGPPGPEGACDDRPNSALNEDNALIQGGEPYSNPPEPLIEQLSNEIYNHHGGSGLFSDADPAPLLIENGWTDDLFPPREALRLYNELRKLDSDGHADKKKADVSVMFGDLGHSRGANKENTNRDFNDRGSSFFKSRIKGDGSGPDKGSAIVYTQTCPVGAPADGPYKADSWPAIHDPDGVSFGDGDEQIVDSAGGNPATGVFYDPIAPPSSNNPCRRTQDEVAPGTAVYTGKESKGYTMVGLPTIHATIDTTDIPPYPGGQLDSRLFDVAPDGQRRLITRGAYRLEDNQDGKVTFQMQGNGWCFEKGHTPKLELLGRDSPYLRPTSGPDSGFTVAVSKLSIDLPTLKKGDPCGRGGGS